MKKFPDLNFGFKPGDFLIPPETFVQMALGEPERYLRMLIKENYELRNCLRACLVLIDSPDNLTVDGLIGCCNDAAERIRKVL